ncbi:hypothetical protein EST38_g5878 [Candolleomyces aberdarensis]|uniref:Copper transport protein n=1 Tax=Candolleomyces aberdarensis TaxID=2316362 RepID=A0A4Q2DL97_9AGAR|nr:hypothetical protein EST38_g5878 [Candolleomyces aberdarensis]
MDMDHGSGMGSSGPACKISMLWNWNVIDSCFISKQWHIRSKGAFAGSCIGVILLVMSVELLRRLGKEYDGSLYRQFQRRATASANGSDGAVLTFRATPLQQLIRAFIHACAFGAAYIVMLLAMYYNGYLIICIFIGAGLGKFVCDWFVVKIHTDTLLEEGGSDKPKGIEETTVCCA